MGVNKSMKIFFEGMLYGTVDGFKSKIVNTAMGPFQWDDLQEAWVNMNNGFRLSNISMQDLLLIGYEGPLSGDNRATDNCDYTTNLVNNGSFVESELTFNDDGGWLINIANYTVQNFNCPIELGFEIVDGNDNPITNNFAGLSGYSIQYSTEGANGSFTTINNNTRITIQPSAFTIGPGGLALKFYTDEGDYADVDPPLFKISIINYSANPNYAIARYSITFTDV
jgi:hypothetical protein